VSKNKLLSTVRIYYVGKKLTIFVDKKDIDEVSIK
jgi:hypothetical protein